MVNSERRIRVSQLSILYSLFSHLAVLCRFSGPAESARLGTKTRRNSELRMVNSERRIRVSQLSILYSPFSHLAVLCRFSGPAESARLGTKTRRNSELRMVNSERRIRVSQLSILYSPFSHLATRRPGIRYSTARNAKRALWRILSPNERRTPPVADGRGCPSPRLVERLVQCADEADLQECSVASGRASASPSAFSSDIPAFTHSWTNLSLPNTSQHSPKPHRHCSGPSAMPI